MKIKCSDCGRKIGRKKEDWKRQSLIIYEDYGLYLCKGCKEDFYHKCIIERGEAERLK